LVGSSVESVCVVQFYPLVCEQVVDTKTNLYLILELGGGGDMYDYIQKNGKLTEDRARHFFRQVRAANIHACMIAYIIADTSTYKHTY
jgi:serine/threonine protein kinase